jgi:hypothetical protein
VDVPHIGYLIFQQNATLQSRVIFKFFAASILAAMIIVLNAIDFTTVIILVA